MFGTIPSEEGSRDSRRAALPHHFIIPGFEVEASAATKASIYSLAMLMLARQVQRKRSITSLSSACSAIARQYGRAPTASRMKIIYFETMMLQESLSRPSSGKR